MFTQPKPNRVAGSLFGAAAGLILAETVTNALDHALALDQIKPFSHVAYWIGGLVSGGMVGAVCIDADGPFHPLPFCLIGIPLLSNFWGHESCQDLHPSQGLLSLSATFFTIVVASMK